MNRGHLIIVATMESYEAHEEAFILTLYNSLEA